MNCLPGFVGRSNGSKYRGGCSLAQVVRPVSGRAGTSVQSMWLLGYSSSPGVAGRALYKADSIWDPLNVDQSYENNKSLLKFSWYFLSQFPENIKP